MQEYLLRNEKRNRNGKQAANGPIRRPVRAQKEQSFKHLQQQLLRKFCVKTAFLTENMKKNQIAGSEKSTEKTQCQKDRKGFFTLEKPSS